MPSNLNTSDFQGFGCQSRWKCQVGDSDRHHMARRALDWFGGGILLSSAWKTPSRNHQKYLKVTFHGVKGPMTLGYGKNQGNLSLGCSCYLCSWVSPEESWITIWILPWPGLISMCRVQQKKLSSKGSKLVHWQSITVREERAQFYQLSCHHPHDLHRLQGMLMGKTDHFLLDWIFLKSSHF